MDKNLNSKRIILFLAIAFGIAWASALYIYLNGGLVNSPLISGTQIPMAIPILAVFYMGAPALANILTRLITREGWQEVYLRPKFKHGWPAWLAAWFGPGLMTIIGIAVFFLLFPAYFDRELGTVMKLLKSTGQLSALNPWLLVLIQTLQALLIAPVLNGLATFGEEFGWRAYLMQKLLPLGWRKAMLLMGIIWGVWHWPVIAMGHNYGLEYPGFPWTGLLMTLWVMFLMGIFLGWAALRGGSVWPAVIGHGALNGIAGLGALLVKGTPNPLIGPLPVGIIGSIAFALVGLWLFFRWKPAQNTTADPQQLADSGVPAEVETSG